MQTQAIALPPLLTLRASVVFAASVDVHALEISHGTLLQRYHVLGLASPTVENEIIYLNINNDLEHTISALRVSDGTSLWNQRVEGRLAGTPVITSGVVYASIVEGTIHALQAHDGTRLWHFTIDLGPDIPSFLGPILFASPTIAGDVVFIAPAVNPPLIPYVYAL